MQLRLSFVVALVAVLNCLLHPGVATAQKPMESLDVNRVGYVAVIDMQELLKEYKPFAERLAHLRDAEGQRRALIEKHQKELADLREQLAEFQPSSPQFRNLQDQILRREAEIIAEEKALRQIIDIGKARLYVAYYQLVRKVVGEFAKERNITLVLNRPRPESNPERRYPATTTLFEQKVVFENKINITNDILDALDAKEIVALPDFELPDPVVLK